MEFVDKNRFADCIGVYAIKNSSDGRAYVGQTRESFMRRFWHHTSVLCNNEHSNESLQAAWNAQGHESFEFVVLEEIKDVAKLDDAERKWIKFFRDKGLSYNISSGGGGRSAPMSGSAKAIVGAKNREHMTGRKHTEETKAKMRASSKHLSPTDEHRKKLSEYMSQRVVSDDTRRKIGAHWDGEKSLTAVINNQQAEEIQRCLMAGMIMKDIASSMNISIGIVSGIAAGQTFKNVAIDGWPEYLASRKEKNRKRKKNK